MRVSKDGLSLAPFLLLGQITEAHPEPVEEEPFIPRQRDGVGLQGPPQALRRGLTIRSCPKPPVLSDSPGFLAPPTGLEPQFFWETQPDHHVLSDTAQARPRDPSQSRSAHLARLRSRAPGCQGPCRSRVSAPGPAQSRRSAYDGGVTKTSKQSTHPRLAHS